MIDSHCHLDFDHFKDIRGQVIDEAKRAGLSTIINIGIDLETSQKSIALAEEYEMVYATVGFHPHDSKKFNEENLTAIRQLCHHPKVVAIGEIGLDYYRDYSPRDIQRKVFRRQLELAVETQLPIVIHTREAFEETYQIVREYAGSLKGGVFHCFPGDYNEAKRVFDLGFIISMGGVITYKNSRMSRLAGKIPLNKVILETDAPFLTPVPHRGKVNQPGYVSFVYRKLSEIRQEPLKNIEKTVDRTCRKFFGLEETFEG